MIATDPVITPARIFRTISPLFEKIEKRAALALRWSGWWRGGRMLIPRPLPGPAGGFPFEESARRPATVADGVLLVRRELGHRAAVIAVGRQERGVVAEAAVAARLVRERPLATLLDHVDATARLGVRERADVRDAPIAVVRHLVEELGEVLLVRRVLAGVAGRVDAGPSAERGRGDARVVGDRRTSCGLRGHARLGGGVLGERLAGLRRQLDFVRERYHDVRGEQRLELAQLVRVAGGEHQLHARLPLGRARAERRLLCLAELLDAGGGEREHVVERGAAERRALRGGLYLDEAAVAGHDHVRVHLGGRVLRVVQVEQRDTPD